MTAKSLRSPPYPPAPGTPWHMYMCVNLPHPHVATLQVATSSLLPQPTFALFSTCPTCGTYTRGVVATVPQPQLDSSTRALDSRLSRLRLDCQQSVVAAIDLRFEYPKLAHFRVSVSRPYILAGTHPPDVGYKVTLIASTSDTRLRSSSSNKRPVTRV